MIDEASDQWSADPWASLSENVMRIGIDELVDGNGAGRSGDLRGCQSREA